MKIFDKLKRKIENALGNSGGGSAPGFDWTIGGGASFGSGNDLSEITYFTCMKTLAESLGKLPLYVMDDEKNRVRGHHSMKLFHREVNVNCIPAEFWTRMEYCRNHYGNAYAYIQTDGTGKPQALWPLPPDHVTIWVNNTGEFTHRKCYYEYRDNPTQKVYWFHPEEVLHVKSWVTSENGFAGLSVREILARNMTGAKASQEFLTDLYRKGLTANAVVKYLGDLDKAKQEALLTRLEEQARQDGRRMITLPLGFDIQPLDLKLTDSQFYELKKYNALQIAAAFGINPNRLNDYSKSSYANSAAQSLSFYVDTLLYNITLYEQELNRKLLTTKENEAGLEFKFNIKVILRGDLEQQAKVLQSFVQTSVYSPNDARRNLDMPPVPGGDVHMVNGSYVKLEDIGKAYNGRGGETE